eukprot:c9326_g2_i1 orf=135-572(+)
MNTATLPRNGISVKQAKADNKLPTTNWDQQVRVVESIPETKKLLSLGFLYSLTGQNPGAASDTSLSARFTTCVIAPSGEQELFASKAWKKLEGCKRADYIRPGVSAPIKNVQGSIKKGATCSSGINSPFNSKNDQPFKAPRPVAN